MFTHSLEDIKYGNIQLLCNKGDGTVGEQVDPILWIQPQDKFGKIVFSFTECYSYISKCLVVNNRYRVLLSTNQS